ncbi:MAG: PRC-barrel domain containing protein [Euryarchaeota archaeon]|nr:PRC-barrel domain containing protein [Euryarchaeota archaeon]
MIVDNNLLIKRFFRGGVKVKASEFIGKTALDNQGFEVGRISDLIIKAKKCLIDKIVLSAGSTLDKKYFGIEEKDIADIGDYVILNLDKKDIDLRIGKEKPEDIGSGISFKEFVGKTVIAQKGMEAGKISDMVIEPKGCLIHNVIISTGSAMRKKHYMVGEGEIRDIGDYVILNLYMPEIQKRTEED